MYVNKVLFLIVYVLYGLLGDRSLLINKLLAGLFNKHTVYKNSN